MQSLISKARGTMKQHLKKLLLLFLFFLSMYGVQAQQDPMYTMYVFNKLPLNPAYAGSTGQISGTLLHRIQWVSFEGAPQTSALSLHAPILNEMSGLGISLVRDEIGIANNLHLAAHYAYRFKLNERTRLALGISGEIQNQQMNWADTNPLDLTDPNLPFANDNVFLPNLGAGIYLDSDRYFASLSIPRFLENGLDYSGGNTAVVTTAQQFRHYLAMAGFITDLGPSLKFRPTALMKYVENAPVEFDFNLSFLISELFWVGAGYRTGDSYHGMVQLQIKDFLRLGYAHDFTYTRLNAHHQGTHEIILSVDFKKKAKGVYHPRYF